MKKYFALFCAGFALIFSTSHVFAADNSDPGVVSQVDLNRYAGLWYDIAHNPNFFQKECLRSTAEYAVKSPTSVSVHNVCDRGERSPLDIRGTATVEDPAIPGKLKVVFEPLGQTGDYWITELDPNYQWAVVSAPAKASLFILSRTAPMDKALLDSIIATLKSKGFNTDELIYDQY